MRVRTLADTYHVELVDGMRVRRPADTYHVELVDGVCGARLPAGRAGSA